MFTEPVFSIETIGNNVHPKETSSINYYIHIVKKIQSNLTDSGDLDSDH